MDEKEFILKRTHGLEELSKEEYADFFRTKDIYCAAFLLSRGFNWTHLELSEVIKKSHKGETKKRFIFFLFPGKHDTEHTALNYFNGNRVNLNVNASAFKDSLLTVRSIITNPPF